MFNWFKKKSKKEILEAQYKKLKAEAYKLSHIDRKASSLKDGEAEEVMRQLELLKE